MLGKRILVLQSTIALLNSQVPAPPSTDAFGRTPFEHHSLQGLPKLQAVHLSDVLSKTRLGPLAQSYGIDKVTRWKPRYVCFDIQAMRLCSANGRSRKECRLRESTSSCPRRCTPSSGRWLCRRAAMWPTKSQETRF